MARPFSFAAFLTLLACTPTQAQPAAPAPPARYHAVVRYRITSARDQHVAHYDAMIEHLKKLGFTFEPPLDTFPESDREDRSKNSITGTIAPTNILKLFANRHIETALLTRPPLKDVVALPGLVTVRLELAPGFTLGRQQELARQASALLNTLGFREAIGYDHRGYTGRPFTRLVGTLPAAQVTTLLKDLRQLPGGWFGPRLEQDRLPAPLRSVVPILVVEVLPDPAPSVEPPEPPGRGATHLDKISSDLWALANDKDKQSEVVRMEIVLAFTPGDQERPWRDPLFAAAPSISIEGRLGPVVTCLARAGQARGLAALPYVSVVRLPRAARIQVAPDIQTGGDKTALKASGLEALHKLGYRGRGVRLAVIDSEFHGWQERVKDGSLPAKTHLVDLTIERSDELFPEPLPGDPKLLGHGTRCALAAALAAPEAEITLIRIDPTTPYMLRDVAGFIAGEPVRSHYLEQRISELVNGSSLLRQRLKILLAERRAVFEKFDDEKDFEREYGILGDVGVWLYSDRQWHFARMAEWERDDAEHRQREVRYLTLVRELQKLRGIDVVSCSLVWNDAYPLGGGSPLSRWFDDRFTGTHGQGAHGQVWTAPTKPAPPPNAKPRYKIVNPRAPVPPPLWFQSAGNTQGQSWNDVFRDEDDNGVMEFAAPSALLPAGRWTNELNFLGWQPFAGAGSLDLPAGARVRISLQWREPHDRDYFFRAGERDAYLEPLAAMQLVVLRQRDPDGKTVPADAFEVVARSPVLPQRLDNQPSSSTYELAVEFTPVKGGRYALRVERQKPTAWMLTGDAQGREWLGQRTGLAPTGIRPLGAATLPDLEKRWEMRARVFVDVLDETSSRRGRPVFLDFATGRGTVGMPGDARALLAVGAAKADGRAEPYSAKGPPANLDYIVRPNVLAYDRLPLGAGQGGVAYGTSLATPFAAGSAATLRSAGMTRGQLLQQLQRNPGAVLKATGR